MGTSVDDARVADHDRPVAEVERELLGLAGQIAAATARFLAVLGDFDERRGWAGDGVRGCAHWLSWRCGLSLVTAREQVRVARLLRSLPRVAEEFGRGRLSYSKVRAVTRVATPSTEAELVTMARTNPAAHVERVTRAMRVAATSRGAATGPDDDPDPDDPGGASAAGSSTPSLRWWWEDDGTLRLAGRLAPEQAAAFLAAAHGAAESLYADRARPDDQGDGDDADDGADEQDQDAADGQGLPGDPAPAPLVAVRDAASGVISSEVVGVLSQAAARTLATCSPLVARAVEVVVHADAAALVAAGRGEPDATDPAHAADAADAAAGQVAPAAHLEGGPALETSLLRRLVCASGVRLTSHGTDGRTLDLGRRRGVTRRQLDVLVRRDGGCAVPACGRRRFLHAHHVVFWALGGRTSLDNLVLLCSDHHRLVHEEPGPAPITIRALGRQRFRFLDRDGREIVAAPPTEGSADELVAAFADVGPDALTPDWRGERLDLDGYLRWWVGTGRSSASAAPSVSVDASAEAA